MTVRKATRLQQYITVFLLSWHTTKDWLQVHDWHWCWVQLSLVLEHVWQGRVDNLMTAIEDVAASLDYGKFK